jgi:hypothetical protein
MSARASLAAAIALIGIAGGPALAEPQSGGVKITGRVENHTVVGPSANIAGGFGSTAVTNVGSIGKGVNVRGNLNMSVQTGEIVTQARGFAEEAITSVGSVHSGAEVSGRRNVVVSTGKIINMSDFPGDTACVVIGSLGVVPGCEEESSR